LIFAWDQKNRDHIAEHGVKTAEAEFVAEHASPPFPEYAGDGKRLVWGLSNTGRWLQVIYVLKDQDEVDFGAVSQLDWLGLEFTPDAKITRVIHAMELTSEMKPKLRRRRK
jgi:uncharacterized DUF497 family protein